VTAASRAPRRSRPDRRDASSSAAGSQGAERNEALPRPRSAKLLALAALAATYLAFGVSYAFLTPIGEAPDEPAHLAYVDTLLAAGALPSPPQTGNELAYESYQPPLEYVVLALARRFTGSGPIHYQLVGNPDFHFSDRPARAFRPPRPESRAPAEAVRILRLVHLLWGVWVIASVLEICLIFARGSLALGMAATIPFALNPQIIFVFATVNNDGLVVALSTAGILFLCRAVTRERAAPALSAGTLAGLALWAKALGLALALPVAIAVGWLIHRRKSLVAAGLALPGTFLGALWMLLSRARFGTLLPPPPTGFAPLAAERVYRLLHLRWIGSLFVSFWGKFGWFNLHLPWLAYACFLLPSLLAAAGALGLSERHHDPALTRAAWLLRLLVVGNVAIVVFFLLRVDWQPQGRFLFPCAGALAGLASLALGRLAADHPGRQVLALAVATALSLIAATCGLWTLCVAYA
jgi:hypothetical protein